MNYTLEVIQQLNGITVTAPAAPTIEVVAAGATGPMGPQGGEAFYIAGETIGGHRVVSMGLDGKTYYASNTVALNASGILGITHGAVNLNDSFSPVRAGEISEPSWSWTPGGRIFLSTNGLLTQTPPVTPALYSLCLGVALSATRMFVNIQQPIFL